MSPKPRKDPRLAHTGTRGRSRVRNILSETGAFFWSLRNEGAGLAMQGPASGPSPGADISLFESGEDLISRIQDAIILRRSVLVTGPRGSGKTYCVQQAIARAKKAGIIRGEHFLQGNREIPRDYLSEDMLVIREEEYDAGGRRRPYPELLDALVLRFPDVEAKEMQGIRATRSPHFPGVRELVDGSEAKTWQSDHWIVLFLDEINRFGDGFLDSLLSLTEERVVVRGGIKLHVPIIVVATANPPGYDVTAKKLSPPLQARISRAYRVSQPTHENLSYIILPDLIRRYERSYDQATRSTQGQVAVKVAVPPDVRRMVSAAALCLWGAPIDSRKGMGFLTLNTRRLLRLAEEADPTLLATDMRQLGELVTFGPDARSVGDWIGAAMGRARLRAMKEKKAEVLLEVNDLLDTALETLGHKVRESFNEGAEPLKVATKEQLISRIVRRVLTHGPVRAIFDIPWEKAIHAISLGTCDVAAAMFIPPHTVPEEKSGAEKGQEVFAWSAVQALAAPELRDFVDRAATWTSKTTIHALFSTSEKRLFTELVPVYALVVLDQLAAVAHSNGLTEIHKALARVRQDLAESPIDSREYLEHAISASQELAPWSRSLERVRSEHRRVLDANLGTFRTWIGLCTASLALLEEVPLPAPSRLERWSPAMADQLAHRTTLDTSLALTEPQRSLLARRLRLLVGTSAVNTTVQGNSPRLPDALVLATLAQLKSDCRHVLRPFFEHIWAEAIGVLAAVAADAPVAAHHPLRLAETG